LKLRTALTAGALALCFTTSALADITVLAGESPGPLDPVALTDGPLDFFVSGVVGPNDTDVSFAGAENLVVQGQRIEAATGTLNFLLFNLADPAIAFTRAAFNLNAAADGPVSIFAYDQFGNQFGGTFNVSGAGNNVFDIAATNGQTIQSVVIQSVAALDDVRNIRLGGIFALIPEPASWALMIIGFGGVGAAVRTRRKLLADT
jgi:hypothetical protein